MDQVRPERAVSSRRAITAGLTDPGGRVRPGRIRSEPKQCEDICNGSSGLEGQAKDSKVQVVATKVHFAIRENAAYWIPTGRYAPI